MTQGEKMATGIERVFRHVHLEGYSGDPLFREVHMHYIHFINPDGTVRKSKLDKMVEGKLWMESKNQRSIHGECEYTFPDGVARRLIVLGTDVRGNPVIPGAILR